MGGGPKYLVGVMGNGIANIIAALIVSLSIIWTGGFGKRGDTEQSLSKDELEQLYARAVGDIRNDIVVSCDEGSGSQGQRRAGGDSFQ